MLLLQMIYENNRCIFSQLQLMISVCKQRRDKSRNLKSQTQTKNSREEKKPKELRVDSESKGSNYGGGFYARTTSDIPRDEEQSSRIDPQSTHVRYRDTLYFRYSHIYFIFFLFLFFMLPFFFSSCLFRFFYFLSNLLNVHRKPFQSIPRTRVDKHSEQKRLVHI